MSFFYGLSFFERVAVGAATGATSAALHGSLNVMHLKYKGRQIHPWDIASKEIYKSEMLDAKDDLLDFMVYGTMIGAFSGGFPHGTLCLMAVLMGEVTGKLILTSFSSDSPRL